MPENNNKPKQGLEKYPEFQDLVNRVAQDAIKAINKEAPSIVSDMRYKCQFTLEEVIRVLEQQV